MNKLRTVIPDNMNILIFLDRVSHIEEPAVRLRTTIGERRITERIARTNDVALHLDFGELAPVAVTEPEHERLTSRLGRPVQINGQIACRFPHFGTDTPHRRCTARHDELFATDTSRHFQKRNRRTRIVHEHRRRSIAPAKSDMDTSIAPYQALAHLLEIRQGRFDKRDVRVRSQSWHLVRMARRNDNLVPLIQKGLDHVMTNKACTTRHKDSHKISFFAYFQYRLYQHASQKNFSYLFAFFAL